MLKSPRLRASGIYRMLDRAGDVLKPNWPKWRRVLHPGYLFAWNHEGPKVVRHSTTAWLDGARGVSALQVYIMHFTIMRYLNGQQVYGSPDTEYSIFAHPLIRPLWFGGTGAICNFFLISGIAITTKSFMLMREGRFDEMYTGLGSAVLRRWFRLWPPVIACSFPMVFVYQFWPYRGQYYKPAYKDSLWAELANYVRLLDISVQPHPFMAHSGPAWLFPYTPQGWTIPLEFHCSMVSFLVVMLVSRMPSFRVRAAVLGFLAFYALHHGVYWTFLFLIGMLMADYNMEQFYSKKKQANRLPWQPTAVATVNNPTPHLNSADTEQNAHAPKQRWLCADRFDPASVFNICLFVFGWYLTGMPMEQPEKVPYEEKPGYEIFYRVKPPKWLFDIAMELRFYQSLSACLLIYSISQSSTLRSVFETRFCQWLGKLSFALYLVHVQIITMFTGIVAVAFLKVTGEFSERLMPHLFVIDFTIVTFITFALSALAWRYVDEPTVRFSKWVDDQLTGRKRKTIEPELEMVAAAAAGHEAAQPLTATFEDSDTEVEEQLTHLGPVH